MSRFLGSRWGEDRSRSGNELVGMRRFFSKLQQFVAAVAQWNKRNLLLKWEVFQNLTGPCRYSIIFKSKTLFLFRKSQR